MRAKTSAPQASAKASRKARAPGSGSNSRASSAKFVRAGSSSKTSRRARSAGCPRCGKTCTCLVTIAPPSRFLPPTSERLICEDGSSLSPASMLPTPTASTYGSNMGGGAGRVGKERHSLQSMAAKGLWPTPTVKGNHNRAGLSPRSGDGLATAVAAQMLPTPTSRDWRSGASNLHGKNSRPLNEVVHRSTPGRLNPTWVEWLMGLPLGWTEW
jgi:hypothetical protein